ncbi:hypothetical protein BBJ29_005672, partial [Phytophthora kernoviae]
MLQIGPIVLRYWGEHYSAFVHHGVQLRLPDLESQEPEYDEATVSEDEERKENDVGKSISTAVSVQKADVITSKGSDDSHRGTAQETWDPADWNGDLDELRGLVAGPKLHRELAVVIQRLLLQEEPEHNLPEGKPLEAIVNNAEDWKKMQKLKYGNDELLQMCAPTRKTRVAAHIVCAGVFSTEIKALCSEESSADGGLAAVVRRHFQ